MNAMQAGEKRNLSALTPLRQLRVRVQHDLPGLDISLFGLNLERHLDDDRYFIFYNQLESPGGELKAQLSEWEGVFELNLDLLPPKVRRLVFVATHDDKPVRDAQHIRWELSGVSFDPRSALKDERAVMIAEVYEHAGEWKVGAVGQGFNGGLQALLESFGGEVAKDSTQVVAAAPTIQVDTRQPTQPQPWPLLSDLRLPMSAANICRRCGHGANLLRRLDPNTGRCNRCQAEVQRGLQGFRQEFLAAARDDVITEAEWRKLWDFVLEQRLDGAEALAFIQSDALSLFNRTVSLAASDGVITAEEEQTASRLIHILELPEALTAPARRTMAVLTEAKQIRSGALPTVATTAVLEAGERCHLDVTTTYHKVSGKGKVPIAGRLLVTNKQVIFTSAGGGHKIKYANILAVTERGSGIELELSVKSGSGLYGFPEPILAAAVLETALRSDKRQLPLQSSRDTRHIPRPVKTEVWNRDAGACVECSANDYLEFDHIIPHSLGGSNTANNIQLLCRRCNLEKSNRI